MGFRDSYTPSTGTSNWIGSEEKRELISDKTAFTVSKVTEREDTYNGKVRTQFVLTLVLEDAPEEERLLAFDQGMVPSRDDLLVNYAKYLSEGGEPDSFIITRPWAGSAGQMLEFSDAE
jgi:hypothetical protein